jgi:hypothetical protein
VAATSASVYIAARPQRVWRYIGGLGSLLDWLPTITESELSSAAPSSRRTVVLEDWALVAVGGRAGSGGHWLGSSWSTPIASVVPLSLWLSMAVEGFHGNRGLVPSSPSVRF